MQVRPFPPSFLPWHRLQDKVGSLIDVSNTLSQRLLSPPNTLG
jgi:hypothetical protein